MLKTGTTAEACMIVGERDTADTIAISPQDRFPEVWATSRMVALMEIAAGRAMAPLLGDGQLSVGVGVNIRHLAASAKGAHVRAVATFLAMDGKLYTFQVQAFDDKGLVGEGEHTRAVVDATRLLSGAKSRLKSGG
jgi:fluoroacetyl-CoA thioesterase